MNVNFEFNEPGAAEKIYFETIEAEKRGGGLVKNPTDADMAPSTPLKYDTDGKTFVKASASDTPVAVLGSWVYKDQGDQMAKIVFKGTLRKENAVITATQANKIAGIILV